MTIIEAINRCDALKPNVCTQEEKIKWLSTLDGMIKSEIIDTHEGGEGVMFTGYDMNTDMNTELIVGAPYDTLYLHWIEAKIDYTNAEYKKYNNSIGTFNTAYSDFSRYYNRTHMPKGKKLKFF